MSCNGPISINSGKYLHQKNSTKIKKKINKIKFTLQLQQERAADAHLQQPRGGGDCRENGPRHTDGHGCVPLSAASSAQRLDLPRVAATDPPLPGTQQAGEHQLLPRDLAEPESGLQPEGLLRLVLEARPLVRPGTDTEHGLSPGTGQIGDESLRHRQHHEASLRQRPQALFPELERRYYRRGSRIAALHLHERRQE